MKMKQIKTDLIALKPTRYASSGSLGSSVRNRNRAKVCAGAERGCTRVPRQEEGPPSSSALATRAHTPAAASPSTRCSWPIRRSSCKEVEKIMCAGQYNNCHGLKTLK